MHAQRSGRAGGPAVRKVGTERGSPITLQTREVKGGLSARRCISGVRTGTRAFATLRIHE